MKISIFFLNVVGGVVLFIGIFSLQAMGAETNLKIADLKLDKSRYMPGDSVKLTYWLRAEGRPHMCFNMGIYVKKGRQQSLLKTWGLPSQLCDALKQGRTISQTWTVEIPDRGPGSYSLSIYADVDHHLKSENNRKDNVMKKTMVVVGNNPDLTISEFTLLPSKPTQGKPFDVRVGIYNRGSAPSNAFTVEWWPGEKYARPAYTWRVKGLPARGGKILTCTYKGYPGGYSKISTRVIADSKEEVKEQNERNNDKVIAIPLMRANANTIDLRPQMPPLVESQGNRNTCSVFAATALMEFLIRAKTGRNMNLSEAYNYWAA